MAGSTFSRRLEQDCQMQGHHTWRDVAMALNRLLAYVAELEDRIQTLESDQPDKGVAIHYGR